MNHKKKLFYGGIQQDNENVTQFSLRLEKLASKFLKSPAREKEVLKVFWKDLNKDIRQLTVSAHPSKLDDAVETARRAELVLKENENCKEIQAVASKVAAVERSSRPSSPSSEREGERRRPRSPDKG